MVVMMMGIGASAGAEATSRRLRATVVTSRVHLLDPTRALLDHVTRVHRALVRVPHRAHRLLLLHRHLPHFNLNFLVTRAQNLKRQFQDSPFSSVWCDFILAHFFDFHDRPD